MSDELKTVLVKTPNGPVRMNETDFEANKERDGLELHTAKKDNEANDAPVDIAQPQGGVSDQPGIVAPGAPIVKNPVAPSNPSPVQYGFEKSGKKFYIINTANGDRIKDTEGVEEKGYDDEASALAAIATMPKGNPHQTT